MKYNYYITITVFIVFFFGMMIYSSDNKFHFFAQLCRIVLLLGVMFYFFNKSYSFIKPKIIKKKNGWNKLLLLDFSLISLIFCLAILFFKYFKEKEELLIKMIVFSIFYIFSLISIVRSNLKERKNI